MDGLFNINTIEANKYYFATALGDKQMQLNYHPPSLDEWPGQSQCTIQ
jgi:hypothetical protein